MIINKVNSYIMKRASNRIIERGYYEEDITKTDSSKRNSNWKKPRKKKEKEES